MKICFLTKRCIFLMCPRLKKHNIRTVGFNKQRGSALMIAVFIILVMSVLTLSLTRNIASSSSQVNNEVLGTRAFFAAEAGNEKALAQLFPVNGGAAVCNADQQMYLTTPGFDLCTVKTSCRQESQSGTDFYYISSKGVCKTGMAGNNSAPNDNDSKCLASDLMCVSRTVDVEAKAI